MSTTVSGHTTSISTNATSINGIQGKYTVKIDNAGHVSGYGLISTNNDGTPTSDFGVRADKFYVAPPATSSSTAPTTNLFKGKIWIDTSSNPSVTKYYDPSANSGSGGWVTSLVSNIPFSILTTPGTINGASVDAGVYIDTAFVGNATITQAQIGTLTADVINSGLLNTVDFYGNNIAGSTIYLGGTVNYTTDGSGNNTGIQSVSNPKITMDSNGATFAADAFTIDNGSGSDTPFQVINNVAYLKGAMIQDATLSFAKVADDIQSTNYSDANNTGWKLEKDGTLDLNSATITAGTLQDTNGNFVIDLTNATLTISS